ncbi:MAG: DNA polymerase III subunit delta' C-terminal domain-containing protein [Candidatus Omnitrophica bacterium]|nr:DNA polymerase III subunit delta' C-terminal domain-containing protein [Candidatus Omnitrophota bacterium]
MSLAVPIAQDNLIELLKGQLRELAVAPAYLVTAPRGFGKETLARAFAASLECEEGRYFESCRCPQCRKVEEGKHPDVHWYGVDEGAYFVKKAAIDDLVRWIGLKPVEGKRKVFIIRDAARLNDEASNKLLKTLEEPPADSHIILLAESKSQLLDTIVSRSFELRMTPLPAAILEELLSKEHGLADEAHFLARWTGGSYGEALRLHEIGFWGLKNECLDAFLKEGPAKFFEGLVSLSRQEILETLDLLMTFLRDLIVFKTTGVVDDLFHKDKLDKLEGLAGYLTSDEILKLVKNLHETREAISGNANQKLAMNRLAVCFGGIKQCTR